MGKGKWSGGVRGGHAGMARGGGERAQAHDWLRET